MIQHFFHLLLIDADINNKAFNGFNPWIEHSEHTGLPEVQYYFIQFGISLKSGLTCNFFMFYDPIKCPTIWVN